MTLPIRALPIVEKWDCHGCSVCCRGSTILLDKNDLARLEEQQWENHPDFQGVTTIVRNGAFGGKHVLAKRGDGSCVFLSDSGRCRIHELFGAEAKPAICRIFPLQLVPLGNLAYVTSRRSCPSAAADRGRPLGEHLQPLKKSGLLARYQAGDVAPPAIVPGLRRDWSSFLTVADEIQRLITDERFPVVRRVVHGLEFCALVEGCKLRRVKEQNWRELMSVLSAGAIEQAGKYFRQRSGPSWATRSLFRQAAVHYIRMHPSFRTEGGWRERWRSLWNSLRFVRGKGDVPLNSVFPSTSFRRLEEPLGPLPEKIRLPLDRYFETHATSKQYAVVSSRRTLVASFRLLALQHPMAMWLLRMASGERAPTENDMVNIVVALERGYGLTPLFRGAAAMAGTEQLQCLIAWYVR